MHTHLISLPHPQLSLTKDPAALNRSTRPVAPVGTHCRPFSTPASGATVPARQKRRQGRVLTLKKRYCFAVVRGQWSVVSLGEATKDRRRRQQQLTTGYRLLTTT